MHLTTELNLNLTFFLLYKLYISAVNSLKAHSELLQKLWASMEPIC